MKELLKKLNRLISLPDDFEIEEIDHSFILKSDILNEEEKFKKTIDKINESWIEEYLKYFSDNEFYTCANCGIFAAIPHSSRTHYHWDGKGIDPNSDINLCIYCQAEHHEYWDEMWREYWHGVL